MRRSMPRDPLRARLPCLTLGPSVSSATTRVYLGDCARNRHQDDLFLIHSSRARTICWRHYLDRRARKSRFRTINERRRACRSQSGSRRIYIRIAICKQGATSSSGVGRRVGRLGATCAGAPVEEEGTALMVQALLAAASPRAGPVLEPLTPIGTGFERRLKVRNVSPAIIPQLRMPNSNLSRFG